MSPCPTLLCASYGVCGEDRSASAIPLFRSPPQARHFALAPTQEQSRRSCSNQPRPRSFRFALTFFRALPLHLSISATHRTRLTPPSVFLLDALVELASALLLSLARACAACEPLTAPALLLGRTGGTTEEGEMAFMLFGPRSSRSYRRRSESV